MNAKRTLIVAMLVILLGQANLRAGETANMVTAIKDLTEQINSIVNGVPFEILSSQCSNDLIIYFSVTEKGEISSVEVRGQNESLSHYAEMKIKQDSIHVAKVLTGLKCKLPVAYNVQ